MIHSIKLLKEAGARVFVADRDPSAPGFRVANGSAPIDIVDAGAIAKYAQEIGANLILVVNGAGVVSGSEASERLGLPGLPMSVARRSQDKGLARDCWRDAGLLQPDYCIVRSRVEFPRAAEKIGYPLVIKPASRWGSRGVCLISTPTELEWAIAIAETDGADSSYIVEQAIQGTEVSVEGLVQNGTPQVLAVADKEMQDHPNFRIGMALNYPAKMSCTQLTAIDNTVTKAVQALGIVNGAFDCECMVNATGVFLLEVNPRPGGGHIFGQIVEAVSGVCMPLAYAKILLGEPVDIRPKRSKGVCYKFFSPPEGIFQSVHGVEEARQTPGVLDLGFNLGTGTCVKPIKADADRPGFVVAQGNDRQEAIAVANKAIASIKYTMQPG